MWTLPVAGASFDPTVVSSVTATWSPASVGSTTYISLMRSAPIDFLTSSRQINAASGSATLPLNGGSIFPMFFMISYKCRILNYFCTNERGPLFHAPNHFSAPVNFNETTGSAESVLPIW